MKQSILYQIINIMAQASAAMLASIGSLIDQSYCFTAWRAHWTVPKMAT